MPPGRLRKFDADISRASDLIGLGQSYASITHGVVDSSDIYRAALVQAVAALDHYCHGVILDRAVDILLGRIVSGQSTKIGISLIAVQDLLSAKSEADRELKARTYVAQRLSTETYQRSESIGTGLAMVGVSKIWTLAFPPPPSVMITRLNLVVDRRNKIVHQGDSDPVTPGSPTPLSSNDSIDAVKTIKLIVDGIDPHC